MFQYIIIAIILAYAFLITQFIIGWFRLSYFSIPDHWHPVTRVSIIIPFKNEIENLDVLLSGLIKQNYPKELFQLIFINDHSSDRGDEIVKAAALKYSNVTLLQASHKGKKAALNQGYQSASGSLFISIDADCIVGPNWLSTIVAFYEKYNYRLIINPVRFDFSNKFWEKFQAIEFQSVMASAAGSVGAKMPILISGANLAFEASLLKGTDDILKSKFESGDDMFLLEFVKKYHADKIGYLKSNEAFATTHPNPDLNSFINQRSRWTSKSGGYSDLHIILSGLIVAAINFLIFPGILLGFINEQLMELIFFAWLVKLAVDTFLLMASSNFFQTKKLLILILPLAIIYPIYVSWVTISGLTGKYFWK